MKTLTLLSIAGMFFLVGVYLLRREIFFRRSAVEVVGRTIGYRRGSFIASEPLQSGYFLEATYKCPFTQAQRTVCSSVGVGSQPIRHQKEVIILVHKEPPHKAKIVSPENFLASGAFFFMGALWLAFAVFIP